MALTSPRLQHDLDRRVRAAYSLDPDRGLRGDTHRSSSVPVALRQHRRGEPTRAVTAPAGYRGGRRGFTVRARMVASQSPTRQCGREEHTGEPGSSITEPRATTPASVLDVEAALTSEGSLSGTSTGDKSLKDNPVVPADMPEEAGSREKAGTVTSDFGAPKLMELMEERDRAVHLCLQYRCKLKNTEGSLRAEERLASDLKSQLREANAAGEATRKLFDQVMEKVRVDEGRKLRQDTSIRQDEKKNAHFAEEARKTRLQLVRARKDLRELWMERDELAMLAGQAIQGEQAGCKRVKKLELAIAGLREQVAGLALSERQAAEKTARAEARATAAEAAERELREAVEAIKHDFEALVLDLRSREKRIRQLETKNATLADKPSPPAPSPHDRIQSRQNSAPTADDCGTAVVLSTRRVSSEDKVGAKGAEALRESRASGLDRPTAGVLTKQENGACGVAAPNPRAESSGQNIAAANAHTVSIALPARKQLTPQASEIPGRVTTISYPRCGSRATFTPLAAPKPAPMMGNASESVRPMKGADFQGEEETVASPSLAQAAGKVPNDLGRLTQRDGSEDKQLGTCEAQPPPLQQPSQETTLEYSPSSQDGRQPPCLLSENVSPKDYRTSSTVTATVPVANENLWTSVGDRGDTGREGGRADDGVTQTERRESSDGIVGGGGATAAPARSPASADNAERDGEKPLPSTSGGVEGVEPGAKVGLEVDVDVESPRPLRLDSVEAGSETPVFRSRLVDGVTVLKYGRRGRGKPKQKVLWVTPDLSEIFYTQMGRTKNPKKTSHMPLAGLCASRGRRDCPDLLRAPTDDLCFALVQTDCLLSGEKGGGHPDKTDGSETDGGGGSPAPGCRKWGIGGTLPANLAHGKRWRGGGAEDAGVGAATTGRLTASSSPGRPATAMASVTATGTGTRMGRAARERMGLETTSAEECTALVDEINELVRRAGLAHGGGPSPRGLELFDDWVRSAELRRDADADADADADVDAEAAGHTAEATRSTL